MTGHNRNVPDAVLARLGDNGGVVMVTFVPGFVSEAARLWGLAANAEIATLVPRPADNAAIEVAMKDWFDAHPQPHATIADVVAHIQHVRDVAGIDHVGLGGDFDGVSALPEGVEGVDAYPRILAALMARGWSEADIRKLAGENMLRVMRAVEAVAAGKRGERPGLAALPEAGAPD